MAVTSTKPFPLKKHSLGSCTVDLPPSNCHGGGHAVQVCDILFCVRLLNVFDITLSMTSGSG